MKHGKEGKQAGFRREPGKKGDGKKAIKESKYRKEAGSKGNASGNQSTYRS